MQVSEIFPAVERVLGQRVLQTQTYADHSSRLVCRVATSTGSFAVKADGQAATFTLEAQAALHLKALGFPVEEPVALEEGPPALLVLPWIGGEGLTSSSPKVHAIRAGQVLARLHLHTGHRPPPEHQSWGQWMGGWTQHALHYWVQTGRAPQDAADQVSRWFDRLRPLFEGRGEQLILFDGRPEHFIWTPSGDVHLIDVAELRSGDGVMDLALMALHVPTQWPQVLQGYGVLGEVGQVLLPFYVFLRALAAAEWDEQRLGGQRRDAYLSIATSSLP